MIKFFDSNILNIISLTIFLIPVSLISGPFIPDFLLSLSCLLFLFYCVKNKQSDFFKINFFYLSSIFYFLILISAILSEEVYVSLKSVAFYFRFIVFSVCVYFIFSKNLKILNYFFKIIFYLFLFIIFDSLLQFIIGYNLAGFDLLVQNSQIRVTSFFGEDLKLGSYLARFFPFFVYSLIIINLKKLDFLKIIILNLYLIIIIMTGERTAILFSFLSLIYLMIFLKNNKLKKYLIITIPLLLLSAIFLLSTNSNLKDRIVNQTINQIFNKDRPNELKLESDKGRNLMAFSYIHDQHYRTAIKVFKDNIFLGSGPKTFRYLCNKGEYKVGPDSCSTHPHNTYIQLLAETGIFSFLIVTLVFLYFLSLSIRELFFRKKIFSNNLQICMICCILINLWPLSPSGNFYNNWLNIIYFFPVGFYILSKTSKDIL